MNSYHSPLLKERVPYDWEELKRAAQELKNGPIPGQSEELSLIHISEPTRH